MKITDVVNALETSLKDVPTRVMIYRVSCQLGKKSFHGPWMPSVGAASVAFKAKLDQLNISLDGTSDVHLSSKPVKFCDLHFADVDLSSKPAKP